MLILSEARLIIGVHPPSRANNLGGLTKCSGGTSICPSGEQMCSLCTESRPLLTEAFRASMYQHTWDLTTCFPSQRACVQQKGLCYTCNHITSSKDGVSLYPKSFSNKHDLQVTIESSPIFFLSFTDATVQCEPWSPI